MSRINAFANHLIDFLDDLRLSFKEVIEIQTAYNQMNIWGDTPAVKHKALKAFMYCCAPLYKEIFHEQEEFFTDMQRLKQVQNQKQFQYYAGDDDYEQQQKMMTILQLKDYWSELSPKNKDKIWAHIKALLIKGAGALTNLKYEPKPEEMEQWNVMMKHCNDLLIFAKKNPELYASKSK